MKLLFIVLFKRGNYVTINVWCTCIMASKTMLIELTCAKWLHAVELSPKLYWSLHSTCKWFIICHTPGKLVGVYSVPHVLPFVHSFVRPSPSLIRYSFKTTEQNFLKFQELFTTWCHTAPTILNFYPHDFGVSQSKTRTLPLRHMGGPISNPLLL